jgi:hypothetical protein
MNNIKEVNHKFWPLFRGVQANDAAVAAEMRETGSSADVAVDRLINANKLALNPAAQSAWYEHISLHEDQRHTAGFVAWAEGYIALETKHERAALEREFPNLRDKSLGALRHQKARHELIEEICALLVSKDGTGRGGKYSNFNIQSVRRQMLDGQWSLAKLQARKEEIIREQALSKRPLSELKAMVKEHYNQPVAFPGWPTLPEKMYDPASRAWIAVDKDYLEMISRHDIFQFKRLVKLYGGPQVDHRRGLLSSVQ